jgi:hypothetical protein
MLGLQATAGNQVVARMVAEARRTTASQSRPTIGTRATAAIQREIDMHEVQLLANDVTANPQVRTWQAVQNAYKALALRELDALDPVPLAARTRVTNDPYLLQLWSTGYLPIKNATQVEMQDPVWLAQVRVDFNQQFALLKARMAGQQPPAATLPGIKIGNEFTFTNEALKTFHKTFKPPKGTTDFKHAYRLALEKGPYDVALKAWKAAMAAYGFAGADGADKYGYNKATFTFPAIGWSYDVTVDDACVEIITPPVPASQLEHGEIARAMDLYIFGVAHNIGLAADPLVGGGHINIDRATGFGAGGQVLYTFLRKFMADADYWKALDKDVKNSPFPDELGRAKELGTVLEKCQDKLQKGEPIDDGSLAVDLIKTVFNTNLAGEKQADSPHYQAVNLEHYNDQAADAQRVEVRRVPAQRSRRELLDQLTRLFNMMR